MFLPTFQATGFQPRANSRGQAVCLLIGFLLTLVGNVSAQTPKYNYFDLKVEHPQFFSFREAFSIEIEAKNVSDQTFTNGDVTVSFKGEAVCKVMTHNATAIRQFPKGSKIYSVEKQRSILSKDLIVQALKDNWRPQQVVHFRLKLTTSSTLPLTMLVRVAGKLKGRKELIFESTLGAKDQQGLYAESFVMLPKFFELNADGEVYEHITTPEGIRSQLLFKLHPEIMQQKSRFAAFDFDNDGTEEFFLEWNKGEYGEIHHYQIYNKKAAGEYALLGEFEIEGMPNGGIGFIRQPDPKQPGKVIFIIQFNSKVGMYYQLRRDGQSADEITTAMNDELVDLDHDGIYEWVLYEFPDPRWYRRIKGMSIFQWDSISFSYQRAWPPDDSVVGGILYDVDDDGNQEIVALTDTGEASNERKLLIYKLSNGVFVLLSQIDVTHPSPASDILGIRRLRGRKQIVLLYEEQDGRRITIGQIVGGYDFKDGRLEFIWLNDKIKTNYASWKLIPTVDGQEEMRFVDKETGQSVILKGEKEFSQE